MLGLAVVTCAVTANPAAGTQFGNTDNTPFATRADGPVGAILVPAPAPGLVYPQAVVSQAAAAQHSPASLGRAERTMQLLQSLGLKSPAARLRFPRTAYHIREGQVQLPDLVRAMQGGNGLGDPANDITFQFQGFTGTEAAALQGYLDGAMPKARMIYGPPAFDITVTVIRDDSLAEIQGGIYDASANEIHLAPLSGNYVEDTFVLMMLVLNAFHDDVAFFYDAWEQGFIGAAATAVQISPGVAPGYDPVVPGPFYCLSVYEAENQPELGNSTFYPASGFAGMLVWRVAMARAAWYKCYIEDPQFFANFNQIYYQSFYEGLPGDIPGLKDIATSAIGTVEGMNFYDWYERQYVLDTSVRTGSKLYTWNIPLVQSVALIAEHYSTDSSGDESPRGGQGRCIYWNYSRTLSLYAEEGYVIDVASSGPSAGEGYLIPTFYNVGGPQQITVQIDLNGLRREYPFPYGVRGYDPGENDLYGGLRGGPAATIDVAGGFAQSGISAQRAVFGASISGGRLTPTQLEVTTTNPQGDSFTRWANVGWDSYVIFLEGGGQSAVGHTFYAGASGLLMITLPMTYEEADAAQILAIPSSDLLLARWDPSRPPRGRYEIWPDIAPFAPGRGFWIRLLDDVTVALQGVIPEEDRSYGVAVDLGWNMIGSPRLEPVAVADLQVEVGTAGAVSFSEAVTRGWMQAGVYGYSQQSGYVLAQTLQPFAGYWVRCLTAEGARLVFPPM